MESYEVLRQAIKPVGCKHVAAELKLSPSLLYQWSRGQDGTSAAVNPLDRVRQIIAATEGDALLDWLCRQRGGEFVRSGKLPARVCDCWKEFKSEMEKLLQAGQTKQKLAAGRWKMANRRWQMEDGR